MVVAGPVFWIGPSGAGQAHDVCWAHRQYCHCWVHAADCTNPGEGETRTREGGGGERDIGGGSGKEGSQVQPLVFGCSLPFAVLGAHAGLPRFPFEGEESGKAVLRPPYHLVK